jgi:hypothetical protein
MKITKKLIEDIVKAEFTLQGYTEDDPVRPVPGPPATAAELAALESYLRGQQLPFPPSYREFLTLANGVRGFKSNFSLVSADVVASPPHKSLVRRYPALSRFMIGRGNSLEFIAFDPGKAAGEELEVVSVADNGDESRYPDFGQYLHERLGQLRRSVELEQSDRKGLKD